MHETIGASSLRGERLKQEIDKKLDQLGFDPETMAKRVVVDAEIPVSPEDLALARYLENAEQVAAATHEAVIATPDTLIPYSTPAGITATNAVESRVPMSLTASHTYLRSDVAVLRSDVQQNLARLAEFYDAKIGELDAKIAHIDRRLG